MTINVVLTATPQSGFAPLEVEFSTSASTTTSTFTGSYTDYGDGSTLSLGSSTPCTGYRLVISDGVETAAVSYTPPGPVTLNDVFDPGATDLLAQFIDQGGDDSIATLSASINLESGDTLRIFEWPVSELVGGSSVITEARLAHRYEEPGTYTASMTLTDLDDNSDTDTEEVVVSLRERRPFEVRRLNADGNGDALNTEGYLRYTANVPDSFLGYMVATPSGYDSVVVKWGDLTAGEGKFVIPVEDLTHLALIRSSFGYPEHPNDGTVVRLSAQVGSTAPAIQSPVTDPNLSEGQWYYYSLMAKYGSSSKWVTVYRAETVVPKDYAHRDVLYGLLPEFYRKQDEKDLYNSDIKNFFWGVGYDLDLTRTLTEGIEEVWNPDTAPMTLLRLLGEQNLGVADAQQLGDVRFRGVISDHREINSRRGTYDGLARFVRAASKYDTYIIEGLNELLLVDDSELIDTVGHWAPAPYTIVDALTDGNVFDTSGTTITVVPASELPDLPYEDF